MSTVMALDMSSTSPGVCVVQSGAFSLYGYAVNNKQYRAWQSCKTENMHVWPPLKKDKDNPYKRMDRMNAIVDQIVALGKTLQNVTVVIENYAYNIDPLKSRSISVLYELGGIVRSALRKNGMPYVEVGISSHKKHFTGYGNATKCMMHKRWSFIGLFEQPACFKASAEKIDHPLEDMVDAFSIACFYLKLYELVKPPLVKVRRHRKAKPVAPSDINSDDNSPIKAPPSTALESFVTTSSKKKRKRIVQIDALEVD